MSDELKRALDEAAAEWGELPEHMKPVGESEGGYAVRRVRRRRELPPIEAALEPRLGDHGREP